MRMRSRTKRKVLLSPLAIIIAVIIFGVSVAGAAIYFGGAGNSGDVSLQKGLVGWWKMDGNAKDTSSNGNNGSGLSGYGYFKQITVTGTAVGAQSNYQMKLTVYKGAGTDSGSSVYLNSHVQDDFDDIRFTNSSGTQLDYWIESSVSGTSAVVWVEFDSIPASPSTASFYINYGNASATAGSNGGNTFVFFDDFTGSS
jgi:hypothetical protein